MIGNDWDKILEEEFKSCSDKMILMTDDGSYGRHGNVTVPLQEMLENELSSLENPFNVSCIDTLYGFSIQGFRVCNILENITPTGYTADITSGFSIFLFSSQIQIASQEPCSECR